MQRKSLEFKEWLYQKKKERAGEMRIGQIVHVDHQGGSIFYFLGSYGGQPLVATNQSAVYMLDPLHGITGYVGRANKMRLPRICGSQRAWDRWAQKIIATIVFEDLSKDKKKER